MIVNPCESTDEKVNKCCPHWTAKMGHNLRSMMKVMRFANGRGKSAYELHSLVPEDVTKVGKYQIDRQTLTYEKKQTKLDATSMIPVCFFEYFNEDTFKKNSFKETSCQLFQPVVTDMGMCHSFNPVPVLDLLEPSYFTESFYEAYKHDLIFNTSLINGTESGRFFNFYLLGNQRMRFSNRGKGSFGSELRPDRFLFGLSNAEEYFNIGESNKIFSAGYKITLNVQAMEIVPTESMTDISIELRQCRLPGENEDLKIFKVYSKPACEFEFRLNKAKDICKCLRWDIPSDSKTRYPICDIYGNYCFKNVWEKHQKSIKECLPGCHQLKFTSSEVREKLDAHYLCTKSSSSTGIRQIAAKLYSLGGMNNFNYVYKLKDWLENGNTNNETYNKTQSKIDFCIDLVNNALVEVTVMFERPEFIRTSTSKRVSFPDQLGVFGRYFIMMYLNVFTIANIIYHFRWNSRFVYRNEYSQHG